MLTKPPLVFGLAQSRYSPLRGRGELAAGWRSRRRPFEAPLETPFVPQGKWGKQCKRAAAFQRVSLLALLIAPRCKRKAPGGPGALSMRGLTQTKYTAEAISCQEIIREE